ncbi:MAG: LLM class flavin-dependent oxidoreductase [Actinomycetota bacterium]
MQRSLYLPPFGTFGDARLLVELAVEAEGAGWDGVFLWDHILPAEPHMPLADAWIALGAIAQATERIRIGPLVTPLARRRPWKVAREAVTLDHLSNGRAVLGVGLGIDFWREFSAFDEPATDDGKRAALVDDGLELIARLWSGAETDGGARFEPPPRQEPRIPIWTAAIWPLRAGPAARAQRWDGIAPFGVAGPLSPDDAAGVAARYPGKDVVLHPRVGVPIDEYADAGVTWLQESLLPDEDLGAVRSIIAKGP